MWPFKKKETPVEAPVQIQATAVEFNYDRLNAQTKKVYDVVKSGKWITLADIAKKTGSAEDSVSARLRDLRKPQNGGLTVERRRKEQGIYEYRLVSA